MGRIQSSIGIITGVPITDTVDQLIALSARPRDLLNSRTKQLQSEQAGIAELTALTLALQLAGKALGKESVFTAKTASSSNAAALTATVTSNPTAGTYQFTPLAQRNRNSI